METERLVIIDEFLSSKTGHYYEYDKSVKEIYESKSNDVTVYGPKNIDSDIQHELSVKNIFNINYTPKYRNIKILGPILFRLSYWWQLKKSLTFICDQERKDNVNFFVPNVYWYNILPYAYVFSKIDCKASLLYRVSLIETIGVPNSFKASMPWIYRTAYKWLNKNPKVKFVTDSDVIAAEFSSLYQDKMFVLPIPHLFEIHSIASPQNNHIRNLYLPGGARIEKGLEVITNALIYLDEHDHEFLSTIQLTLQVFGDKERNEIDQCLNRLKKTSLSLRVLGSLSSNDYKKELIESDIILIPYLNSHGYRARTSGILSEAIACEKPFITTKDSWMAVQAEKYETGLTIEENNAQELALAIKALVSNYQDFKEKSINAKEKWLAFHSKDNFYKILSQ